MNNETKLTAADLALYLGCEVYAETPTASGTVHVRRGRFVGIRPAEKRRINPITVDIETESGGVIDMYFLPEQVKPILRPLSDMTEEELLEFAKLCSGAEYVEIVESAISNYKNVMCFADFHDSERLVVNDRGEVWYASYFQNKPAGRNTINHHEQTVWLLRHHFDIFEWAKAGLAIDKTKTVTP